MLEPLGTIGIWRTAKQLNPDLAAGLEDLGYGAIWIGGSPTGDLALAESLLKATTSISVATGIVNIWTDPADVVGQSYHRLQEAYPGRFVLGIGAGHPEAQGKTYTRPYEAISRYLDDLDTAGVPLEHRVLAALGPRMSKLAAERTAGSHPYLTTPSHTRTTRELLGPGPFIAPDQKVVLAPDPVEAMALARASVEVYLGLVNYTNSWRTLGFDDPDFADGGSDRLIKTLFAIGNPSTALRRVREHLAAGASHVAVQLVSRSAQDPMPEYTALAKSLL